ncbi:MAG: glycerol kinase GlpK [Bacteroidota bacterium]
MQPSYILALDQGTTSSRAIIFNHETHIVGMAQHEINRFFPQDGWVEQDATEILNSQLAVAREVLAANDISPQQIAAIGITNQRETTIVWNRHTGKPVHPAIVWQDRRTAGICEALKQREGIEAYIRAKTGLVIDAYFSGTKLHWILNHLRESQPELDLSDLCFGTVDCWLIWNLTGGKVFATDHTNASRTLLYNIQTLSWDNWLLDELDIPAKILPEVRPSRGDFGTTEPALFDGVSIPICGVAGDQQAALFGQACVQPGMTKNTYGTGCFILMNTGKEQVHSQNGLLTTITCGLDGEVEYALEGSIFVAGSAVQWLRDGLKILDEAPDSEYYATKARDTQGVYVVPAFAGLGAPYWDMYARGAILGITQGTTKAHIVRATLESLAYQTRDVIEAMQQDAGVPLTNLRVDGGASQNNWLMQFQSSMLNVPVERPAVTETTALGAAYLAGLAQGFWQEQEVTDGWRLDQGFQPIMDAEKRKRLYRGWQKAVGRSKGWAE